MRMLWKKMLALIGRATAMGALAFTLTGGALVLSPAAAHAQGFSIGVAGRNGWFSATVNQPTYYPGYAYPAYTYPAYPAYSYRQTCYPSYYQPTYVAPYYGGYYPGYYGRRYWRHDRGRHRGWYRGRGHRHWRD